MDRQLLDLVGVGVVLFADHEGDVPRPHALAGGRELVRRCLVAGIEDFDVLVHRTAAKTWAALRKDTPQDIALALEVGAMLLQRHPPPAGKIANANAQRECHGEDHDFARSAVTRLTDCVVSAALVEGSLDHAGLQPDDAKSVLSALFTSLTAEAAAINDVAAKVVAAVRGRFSDLSAKLDDEDAWHHDAVDEHVTRLCHDLGLPRALLECLIEAQRHTGFGDQQIAASLDETAASVVETLDGLRQLPDFVGADEALEAQLNDCAAVVRDGRLAEAAAKLDDVIASLSRPSSMRLALRQSDLLVGTTVARARIAGHLSAWREASVLYRKASRACAASDRMQRWRMKLGEGRALVRLAELPGATTTELTQATQVFAEAGGITSEIDHPLEWAEANLELGALLLRLGDRQCRPERFLAAALHFKPALDVLTNMRAMDGWARAQIGLAHALRGQGSFQGDVVTLGDAVFAYRAALGILTRGMTPELWYEASAALGEALVRISEETGDHELLQEAMDILMPLAALDAASASGRTHTLASLALGRGILLLVEFDGGSDSDVDMLNEALVLVEGALRAPVRHLNALERARGQRIRGTLLGHLAFATGSEALLERAIDTKSRAATLYRALENEPEADQLLRELDELSGDRQVKSAGGAAAADAENLTGQIEPHAISPTAEHRHAGQFAS